MFSLDIGCLRRLKNRQKSDGNGNTKDRVGLKGDMYHDSLPARQLVVTKKNKDL